MASRPGVTQHCFTRHGHVHQLVVTPDVTGWQVLEQRDATVLTRVHREDWHRVERDVMIFERAVPAVPRDGTVTTG